MLPLVLETLIDSLKRDKITWVSDEPTDDDLNHIMEQREKSEFDPLQLRLNTINDLRAGKARLICKTSAYAKILAVVYDDTKVPWDTFADIFAAFGPPASGSWRVVWFANPTKRELSVDTLPGPLNVNGGYTYPCNATTIVIYREEEAPRVLLHELLHAACTDNPAHGIEEREVRTETWAELFLVAVTAKGKRKAAELWSKQAQWIADQEAVLRNLGVSDASSYCWRYTVGRRAVLEELGILIPYANLKEAEARLKGSMRLTIV